MSVARGKVDQLQLTIASALHEHWLFYLFEGIILLALGLTPLVAFIASPVATLTVTTFLGWVLLVSGLVGLFTTFRMQGVPGFWWSLISAILALVIGALLIVKPISGAFSLTLLLVAFFLIEGVASIMYALDHRHELSGAWAWMLASGIVDLLLAAFVFAEFPGAAVWTLGILVGINLSFGGIALIAMALRARRINPHVLIAT